MRRRSAARNAHWAYRLTWWRVLVVRLVGLLPPSRRAGVAERHLRRAGQPGPAGEHVAQYLLSHRLRTRRSSSASTPASAVTDRPVVVAQADYFYRT